jgi:hypothetical protein
MIEMDFIGGPLDGSKEMRPEEIRTAIQVAAQTTGYYQLCEKANEEVRPFTILNLSPEDVKELYHYLWIPKESRGKTANV